VASSLRAHLPRKSVTPYLKDGTFFRRYRYQYLSSRSTPQKIAEKSGRSRRALRLISR
jgi:CRISPR/Cas system-associated protein Cas5 (RAMP superfamily)